MALTTKDKLSEQVLNELNKRNIDSNFKTGDVILRIQQTLAWFIRQRFFTSKADEVADVDGSYFFTFKNQPVLLDEDMGHYYISVPATSIELPHGAGIGKITPMKGVNDGYKPVGYGFSDLFKGLAASTLENSIGYYPIGDAEKGAKIVFVNMNGSNNPDKVAITMVVPFDGIDDDVVLNIPMDIQREVIDTAVGYFAGAPQKDNTNDRVDQV
jgi:hypothetical protein